MAKVSKVTGLIGLFIFILISFAYSVDETFTITTYYPSPYGVYNELKLYPHTSASVACSSAQEGLLWYALDTTAPGQRNVRVCSTPDNGVTWNWYVLGGGGTGVGSYWSRDTTSGFLYPTTTTDQVTGSASPTTQPITFTSNSSTIGAIVASSPNYPTIISRNSGTGTTSFYAVEANGTGIAGGVMGSSSSAYGVYGSSSSSYGVVGVSNNLNSNHRGVHGSGYYGVYGSGTNAGVYGLSGSYGVMGAASSGIAGVFGVGGTYGLWGQGTTYGVYGAGTTYGVYGAGTYGVTGNGTTWDLNAVNGSLSWTSSLRFKRNIRPIDNSLGRVVQLRGVYFDWDQQHGGRHDIGLIAEEVGKVFPELTYYEPDGKSAMGIDYGRLSTVLVEAIKEQQKEIDNLKQEIASLKKQK